jgi:hypothetical protein
MAIEGYQFCSMLHGLCGNPNIIRRDRASATLQVYRNPGISVRCHCSYLKQLHRWMFEEEIQVSHVILEFSATAKSKYQLSKNNW